MARRPEARPPVGEPASRDDSQDVAAPPRTAQAVVSEQLRAEILTGSLPAGSRLVHADVAQRLGTSTTPVREAVRQLASEGLLRVDAHRTVTVPTPSLAELAEIYEVRRLLEEAAIAKVVERVTDEQLDRAAQLVAEMDDVGEGEVGRWVSLNRRFHATLLEACQSPRLVGLIANLLDLSMLYVGVSLRADPVRLRRANAEHVEILAACRARDEARARSIVGQHLKATLTLGQRYLERGDQPGEQEKPGSSGRPGERSDA